MDSNQDRLKPGSDEWWVHRLNEKLKKQRKHAKNLIEIYEGKPLIEMKNEAATEGFKQFLGMANLNLAKLIVSTMAARMQPLAFKTGADEDPNGDQEAQRLFKRCQLERTFAENINLGLITGYGYLLVSRYNGQSWVTPESPLQVVTEQHPITRESEAGLKVYHNDFEDKDYAVLYRPGYYVEFTRESKDPNPSFDNSDPSTWTRGRTVRLNSKKCALFRSGTGKGEFEEHIQSLRRINHTILQRMVIITLQAFKQRAIKGVPRTDPKTGKEINYEEIFTTDPGAMWILPATAEVWESTQADLTPIITSIKEDIKNLAVESATALYTITPDAAQGSAEGAALQRETQIFKIEDRLRYFSPAFEGAMAMAFELDGDSSRGDVERMEVMWMDPNRSSLTERAASAMQASQAGAPWSYTMTKFLKMTPRELAEAEKERRKEQMMMEAAQNAANPSNDGIQPANGSSDGQPAEGTGGDLEGPQNVRT